MTSILEKMNLKLILENLMQLKELLILNHLEEVLVTIQVIIMITVVKVEDHQIGLASVQGEQVTLVDLLVVTLNTTMITVNHQD